jgi:hypothetical protein
MQLLFGPKKSRLFCQISFELIRCLLLPVGLLGSLACLNFQVNAAGLSNLNAHALHK